MYSMFTCIEFVDGFSLPSSTYKQPHTPTQLFIHSSICIHQQTTSRQYSTHSALRKPPYRYQAKSHHLVTPSQMHPPIKPTSQAIPAQHDTTSQDNVVGGEIRKGNCPERPTTRPLFCHLPSNNDVHVHPRMIRSSE